jgi:hypothetical protein
MPDWDLIRDLGIQLLATGQSVFLSTRQFRLSWHSKGGAMAFPFHFYAWLDDKLNFDSHRLFCRDGVETHAAIAPEIRVGRSENAKKSAKSPQKPPSPLSIAALGVMISGL